MLQEYEWSTLVVGVELSDQRSKPIIEGTKNLIHIIHSTPSWLGLTTSSLVWDATKRFHSC